MEEKKDFFDKSFELFNREEKIKNQIFHIWLILEKNEMTELSFINNLSFSFLEVMNLIEDLIGPDEWALTVCKMSESTAKTLLILREMQELTLTTPED